VLPDKKLPDFMLPEDAVAGFGGHRKLRDSASSDDRFLKSLAVCKIGLLPVWRPSDHEFKIATNISLAL
jgi:hypothetical protein